MRNLARRILGVILPWYDVQAHEARANRIDDALRESRVLRLRAKRLLAIRASYRAADGRLGRR